MSIVETLVEEDMPEPKRGARVLLSDLDRTFLGYATYVGMVPVMEFVAAWNEDEDLEPDDPELSEEENELAKLMMDLARANATTEKFVLESGKVVYGIECTWKVVSEEAARLN